MITMKIDPDKIREVIGTGGKVIQKIMRRRPAPQIDIEDDGTIYIAGPDNAESCDAAKKTIETIVFVPEVGAAVLRQGGAHPPVRRLRGAGPRQGRHGPHLQAGRPPGGEGGGRGQHRRHDLGQGHRHRRQGPGQPLLPGRPEGDQGQEGRRREREVSVPFHQMTDKMPRA